MQFLVETDEADAFAMIKPDAVGVPYTRETVSIDEETQEEKEEAEADEGGERGAAKVLDQMHGTYSLRVFVTDRSHDSTHRTSPAHIAPVIPNRLPGSCLPPHYPSSLAEALTWPP